MRCAAWGNLDRLQSHQSIFQPTRLVPPRSQVRRYLSRTFIPQIGIEFFYTLSYLILGLLSKTSMHFRISTIVLLVVGVNGLAVPST